MALDNTNLHGADDLIRRIHEAQEYIFQDVPVVIGVEAVNHFKESFQNEGFTDTNITKWASRKTKRAGGTNNQKILTKSGELGDSIDYRISGTTIIIYSDKPYAKIHNEGGVIPVTSQMKKYFWAMSLQAKEAGNLEEANQYKYMALAKQITIVERKFMGESHQLNQNIADKITRDLQRILNN